MGWKPWFRRLHLWLALVASLPLVVLAVTGALLVFPDQSRRLATAVDLRVEPGANHLPPSKFLASVSTVLPAGERIARLVYPKSSRDVLWAETERHVVAVDPFTGRVLRVGQTRGDFIHVVTAIHVNLLAGKVGAWITGLSAIVLMGLCASGLRLWWPVGRWGPAYLLINLRRGPKRVNFDLHRIAGLYSGAFLFVIALTGATMAFWDVFSPLAYWMTWSAPTTDAPRMVRPPEGAESVSPDRALGSALGQYPGHEPRRLYLPPDPTRPYRVFLDPPGEHETRINEVRLEIDPDTGLVLHEEGPRTMSRGDKLLRYVLPLHFGTFGGTATKLLYVAVSLSPLLLASTGFFLWRNRRLKLKPRIRSLPESGATFDAPERETSLWSPR